MKVRQKIGFMISRQSLSVNRVVICSFSKNLPAAGIELSLTRNIYISTDRFSIIVLVAYEEVSFGVLGENNYECEKNLLNGAS